MLKIRVRVSFPQKSVLKKLRHNFCFLPLTFCKPNNKLFLNMPNMGKNVIANCDLVNESIETSLQTKEKWILIRKLWYKFE